LVSLIRWDRKIATKPDRRLKTQYLQILTRKVADLKGRHQLRRNLLLAIKIVGFAKQSASFARFFRPATDQLHRSRESKPINPDMPDVSRSVSHLKNYHLSIARNHQPFERDGFRSWTCLLSEMAKPQVVLALADYP